MWPRRGLSKRVIPVRSIARYYQSVRRKKYFGNWCTVLTIRSHFHEILDAVLHLYDELVSLPSGDEIPDQIRNDPRRWPAFIDCVGALDGSHFHLHVPADQQKRFRNRHGKLTQNVLAVVDFEMNFTYVLAGWEGSAHDARVYNNAIDRGLKAPAGKYFVADAGYSNSGMTLSPYRGVRYHLREIKAAGKDPQDKYELYNFRHSSLRNVVERIFGVFKRRWRLFDRPHEFSIRTQVKLVYALVAIHNLINKFYPVGSDFDRFEPCENEMDGDEEIAPESVRQDAEMDGKREAIANLLWQQYGET